MRSSIVNVLFAATIGSISCGGEVAPSSRSTDTSSTTGPKPRGCPDAIPASTRASPGTPHRLASTTQVLGLDVGPNDVFFAVYGTDTDQPYLWKVPKVGGAAELLGTSNQDVRVDDSYAYAGGSRYPVGGGPAEPALSGFSFALDADYIYMADFTTISRAPKGTFDTTILQSNRNGAQGISTSGDWIYWADYSGDQVLRTPKVGGSIEVLTTGHFPRHVVADCIEAFATIGNYGGPVVAATLTADHATRTVASFGSSLAIDDGSLYVFGPTVFRVALDGSEDPQPIGTGSTYEATGDAVQIAVDNTSVYWAADDGVWAALK